MEETMALMNLKGKTAAKAGLAGGILTTASLALTWISISFSQAAATVSADANGFWGEVDVRFTSMKAGGISLTSMPGIVEPGGQARR